MTIFNAIHSTAAPKAIGCYSQATQVGNFVFLSGQIGLDPATTELVSGGTKAQLAQIMRNMQAVMKAAGGDFSHIVKLTIYLQSLQDFSLLNEAMKQHFTEPYPARTTIEVAGLPKGAAAELEAILFIPQ